MLGCAQEQPSAGEAPASGPAAPVAPGRLQVRYATANPEQSAHVQHIRKFAQLLERYTQGRMQLQLEVGGVRGSEQDNVMDVSSGALHMSTLAVNNVTSFAPAVGFMTLPYVFEDVPAARRLLLSNNRTMERVTRAMVADGNIRPLGWLNSGYRVFSNDKRTVRAPGDLRGLRIRVPENPIMVATYRAWGVEPIPLPWTKTYAALEQGTVDAQDNPYLSNVNMPMARKPFFEVQKYITDLHYNLLILVHIINEDFYRSLPADLQQAMTRAARESTACLWNWVDGETQRLERLLQQRGMVVTQPADAEREWAKRGRSVWPTFYARIGGRDFVEQAVAFMSDSASSRPQQAEASCPSPIETHTAGEPEEFAGRASLGTVVLGGVVRCPYLCAPESGRPGFLVEIARAAFEPRGYRVEVADVPWSRAIQQAKRGDIAGLVGAMRRNAPDLVYPEVEQAFTRMGFFVKRSNPWRYAGLVSLRKVELGLIQDFSYGELDSYVRKHLGTDRVQPLSGQRPLLRNIEKLGLGRVSAIVEDDIVMRYKLRTLARSDELQRAGELTGENVYIAFSRKDPKAHHYAQQLSRAMVTLRESGELDRILSSYGLQDWR